MYYLFEDEKKKECGKGGTHCLGLKQFQGFPLLYRPSLGEQDTQAGANGRFHRLNEQGGLLTPTATWASYLKKKRFDYYRLSKRKAQFT